MSELTRTKKQARRIQHALQKLSIARRLVKEAEGDLKRAIEAACEPAKAVTAPTEMAH
jgi:hypothetical protein